MKASFAPGFCWPALARRICVAVSQALRVSPPVYSACKVKNDRYGLAGLIGAAGRPVSVVHALFGRGWEIPVDLSHGTYTADDAAGILDAFDKAYEILFGRTIDGPAVEITNWSLVVETVL